MPGSSRHVQLGRSLLLTLLVIRDCRAAGSTVDWKRSRASIGRSQADLYYLWIAGVSAGSRYMTYCKEKKGPGGANRGDRCPRPVDAILAQVCMVHWGLGVRGMMLHGHELQSSVGYLVATRLQGLALLSRLAGH